MKNIFTRITLILTATIIAFTSPAQTPAQRKKVGVVLSGGGAKGVAHISALKAIEEAGIPIDVITGTSMGAIIGGLYAIGYSPHTLDSMVRTQNWPALLSDKVSRNNLSFIEKESDEKYLLTMPLVHKKGIAIPSGIVEGQNVYNLLAELTIGYHDSLDFSTFDIPFACVAFDMVKGETVTFRSGHLPLAIRASMSIPGAFAPIRKDGMVLVDGGIANNYPVDVAREMGAEIIIGIDVSAGLRQEEELLGMGDLIDQITNITASYALEQNKAMTDLYIHPDIYGFTAASFAAADIDTLIVRGQVAMEENRDALIALKDKIGIPRDYAEPHRQELSIDRQIAIDDIRFEGLKNYDEKKILRLTGLKGQSEITTTELHNAAANLQGSGLFSSVKFHFEGESPYDIVFSIKENSHNYAGLGFRFDSEEKAALLLHVTLTPRKFGSTYLFATGRLSSNPYIKTGIETGNEVKHKFSLSYMFQDNNIDIYNRGKRNNNMDYRYHLADLHFKNIQIKNFKVETGLQYEYFHYESQLWANNSVFRAKIKSDGLASYYLKTQLESLNRRYYPTKGMSLLASYTLYTSDFVTYKGHSPFGAISVDFFAPFAINKRITVTPGLFSRVLAGSQRTYPALNFAGGAVAGRYLRQQLPFYGIHNLELFEDAIVGIKMDFRVKMWRRNYTSFKFNYMKHHEDFFNINHGKDVIGGALCYSHSTIVGPIDFLIDWSNRSKDLGFYFNFGYYF